MTRDEHLMTIAMEECAELAQRISKAQRFGMHEVQPDQALSNRERIVDEYMDLIAALEMLGIWTLDRSKIDAKHRKVERFLDYSAQCGTLTPTRRKDQPNE